MSLVFVAVTGLQRSQEPLLRATARFRDLANARQAQVIPFNSNGLDHRQSLEIGLGAVHQQLGLPWVVQH